MSIKELLQQINQIKSQADALWHEAKDQLLAEYDEQEYEDAISKALDKYLDARHSLLEFHEQNPNLLTDPEFIESENTTTLYYIEKVIADACYDRGEYQYVAEHYQRAQILLEMTQVKQYFTQAQVKSFQSSMLYNAALANFYRLVKLKLEGELEGDLNDEQKQFLVTVSNVLIDRLLELRTKKAAMMTTKESLIQDLLGAQKLYLGLSGLYVEQFNNWFDRQKFQWVLSEVLDKQSLLNFVISEDYQESVSSYSDFEDNHLTIAHVKQAKKFDPKVFPLGKTLDKIKLNVESFENRGKLSLYPFQLEALDKYHEHIGQGANKGYFVMATGTGKTRVFISLIVESGVKTIVVVPSRALAYQTRDRVIKMFAVLGINKKLGVFADKNRQGNADIVVMTAGGLRAQLKRPPTKRDINLDAFKMVVIDEAHMMLTKSAKDMIDRLAQSKVVVACTATDEYNIQRNKGDYNSLKEVYGEGNEIFRYPLEVAVENKSLCPVHVCMVTTEARLSWKRGGGKKKKDVTEAEAAEQINKEKLNLVVAELYMNAVCPSTGKRLFDGQTTHEQGAVFCAGIKHAKAVADSLNTAFGTNEYFVSKGITPAVAITGELDGEAQQKVLNDFRNGKIAMLCGADLLITGIDNPNISVIFNLRPTRSQVLALQRLGRGTRLSQDKDKLLKVFEFNWLLNGQKFAYDFWEGDNNLLGEVPAIDADYKKFIVMRREHVGNHFQFTDESEKKHDASKWSLDWHGRVRQHAVGRMRGQAKQLVEAVPAPPLPPAIDSQSGSSTRGIKRDLETSGSAEFESPKHPRVNAASQPIELENQPFTNPFDQGGMFGSDPLLAPLDSEKVDTSWIDDVFADNAFGVPSAPVPDDDENPELGLGSLFF